MRHRAPTETAPNEHRVALVPESVAKLVKAGLAVTVQRGAGAAAHFADDAYADAGAALAGDAAAAYRGAGLVLKVQRPSLEEAALVPEGAVLVCLMQPGQSAELVARLAER